MSSGNSLTTAGKQLSESFEPAAAAEAINAVLRAPSVSVSSGLEMQTEVELGDKDVAMEPKEDLPSPKSPEPEWELADPIPDTASELVGDLLLGQEEEDRAQFVFLSEWGQVEKDRTMGEVKSQLDDLTRHIQELSVGGTVPADHGPHPDEPPMVAVEPAGDGLFRLTCFPEPFPHVSRAVSSLLAGLTVKEVAQLFDLFQGKPLTWCGKSAGMLCDHQTEKRPREPPEAPLQQELDQAWNWLC